MELLGKLEQARMQEQVNQTLEQLSKPMESTAGPTLGEIEDKINRRMANASARAELESASIEGAQRDVERSLQQVSAQARLDKLRVELGLPAPASATPAAAPAAVESAAEQPAVAPAPAEEPADEQPAQGGGSAPA
jgi:phage shock protein A